MQKRHGIANLQVFPAKEGAHLQSGTDISVGRNTTRHNQLMDARGTCYCPGSAPTHALRQVLNSCMLK